MCSDAHSITLGSYLSYKKMNKQAKTGTQAWVIFPLIPKHIWCKHSKDNH